MEIPEILEYSDYRRFLNDWYGLRKGSRAGYSYRRFAEDLGFMASNYPHLIVAGKRNLSYDGIQKICDVTDWSTKKKRYFETLVLFNQAKEEGEKQRYQKGLEKILGKKRKLLNPDQYAYFSNWYLPILREIIALKSFVPALEWIIHKLWFRIDKSLVKEGLQILARLKMIVCEEKTWRQNEEHLATPPYVTSNLIHHYHAEMLKLSQQALSLPNEERDISALTMGLSRKQFEHVKQRIIEFRDELQQELEDTNEESDMVAQLNVQLFSVTRK